MADDWRVEMDVEDHDALHRAIDRLRERGVAREARHRLGDDVVISVDADRIFAYTQTQQAAEEAARVLVELARDHHLTADATIAHWDSGAERWEPSDAPSP
jgi:predicted alpha/beta hydrolase family esterase